MDGELQTTNPMAILVAEGDTVCYYVVETILHHHILSALWYTSRVKNDTPASQAL
jgi:hypothetical protein